MSGPEVSLLCLCDGRRAVPLASAQDYKRARRRRRRSEHRRHGRLLAGARPSTPPKAERLTERLVAPTLHELRRRGIDYRGVLYAGLMLTPEGPEGARVQRALRRSRDAGGAAALDRRRRRDPRRLCVGIVAGATDVLERRRGARSCVRPRAIPWRRARRRHRRRAGGGRGPPGVARVLRRRGRGRRRAGSSPPAVGCSTSPRLGPTVAEARSRAYAAVRATTWPGLPRPHGRRRPGSEVCWRGHPRRPAASTGGDRPGPSSPPSRSSRRMAMPPMTSAPVARTMSLSLSSARRGSSAKVTNVTARLPRHGRQLVLDPTAAAWPLPEEDQPVRPRPDHDEVGGAERLEVDRRDRGRPCCRRPGRLSSSPMISAARLVLPVRLS